MYFLSSAFFSPKSTNLLCSLLYVVMQREEKELYIVFSCYFWRKGICGVIL